TPAATTRGFSESEFTQIGNFIAEVLDSLSLARNDRENTSVEIAVKKKVHDMTSEFPLYSYLSSC
ncbi:MAG: serine hydroxymethyltransferase, partial [Bartonella sp.]|nr:serine hydroxymethyltransferase [Bartonella sp.]